MSSALLAATLSLPSLSFALSAAEWGKLLLLQAYSLRMNYAQMGIREIFVLDPRTERVFRCTDSELPRAEPASGLASAPGLVDWLKIAALRD